MDIPLLDLKAQYQSIQDEINKKLLDVVSSQRFILGAEVESLEKEIADYIGARFAVGVSSGSDALIISLMSLGIGNGDAVLTTPFTFFASAGAIVRVGAIPVFCDIDEKTYNLDPNLIEDILNKKTIHQGNSKIKAIMPVHLYGQCSDMTAISEIAKKHALYTIEDAAQAIGSEYPTPQGIKKTCTLGDMGTLSFFPSKNLGGFGDGGMVLTNKKEWAEKLKILRTHGSRSKYYYDTIGGNFRLDAIQAAILRVKLKYLEEWLIKRQENASFYDRLFANSGLSDKAFIQTPEAVYKNSGVTRYHTYHQYIIRAKKRDELKEFLSEKGVPSAIFYPLSLHLQKCFADLGYKKGDFPKSEKAADEVLALPIYPELKPEQQEYIVSSINEFYQKVI